MEELKVEGLVINKEEVNENDRIITIFEENRGKIKMLCLRYLQFPKRWFIHYNIERMEKGNIYE